jgi:hypothetical protein
MRLPEIQETMTQLSREMARAGLIEETMNETFEMMEVCQLSSLLNSTSSSHSPVA